MPPTSMRPFARAVLPLAAVLAVASRASGAEPGTNLLENGGFEQGVSGWRVLDMSGSVAFEPDEKVKRKGHKSLRVEKRAPGRTDFLKQSARLPLGVEVVTAWCWFKVDKGARAEVEVYFFDASDETVGKGYVALVNSGPTKTWLSTTADLEVPKGAVGVGVNVKVNAKGTYWLDDLWIGYAGGGGLGNGGFEKGLHGWRPLEHGSGAAGVTVDPSVHAAGKSSARVVRTSARLLPEDGLYAEMGVATPPRARQVRFSFQARSDGAARASVAVQVLDERGVCVAIARSPVVAAGKAFVPGEVAIDVPDDGKRLVVSLVVVGEGTAWFDEVDYAWERK
jgi:hypothetical protein